MSKALWWIKRDFRLTDNAALTMATENNQEVLPLFAFEPGLIAQPDYSPMHVWAWRKALEDLKKSTHKKKGNVLVATEEIITVLTHLKKFWDFDHIYAHEETGNDWTFSRDKRVMAWAKKNNIKFIEIPQTGVIRRLKSRADRQPIIKERLIESTPLPEPKDLKFPQSCQDLCETKSIPGLSQFFDMKEYEHIQWEELQVVSETAGQKDLASFLNDRGQGYSGGISSPNTAFRHGSRLSVHLAWGTLSLRTIFHATLQKIGQHKGQPDPLDKKWGRSLRAFSSRLHWHDHFIQRLESEPNMEFQAINTAYDQVRYEDDPQKLNAWKYGQTGFPMVDACMRCLQATGFLNFRMRAMVVSFACFGLHLSWRTIHPSLAQIFLDYEPGIHLSQLQMQAGIVGINTIRVYSPSKQIEDQDPDCKFIKHWIPELRDFTSTEIKSYEKISLGDYPRPIVDFKPRAKAMKDQIFAIRKSEAGKAASQAVLTKHGSQKKKKKPVQKKPPQASLGI